MSSSRFAHLPRTKRLTGKPPSREDRFVAELERRFPGSEWDTSTADAAPRPGETPGSRLRHRMKLLACVDQALAHGKAFQSGSLPASMPSSKDEATPARGAGTYFIVGGGKYNPQSLRKWLRELGSEHIVTTEPKRKKNGEPMASVEAIVLDVKPDATTRELRSDHYPAPLAAALAGADLAAEALDGGVLVLVGTGARVARARAVGERLGRYAPPLVELP